MDDKLFGLDLIGSQGYHKLAKKFVRKNPNYVYSTLLHASGWSERNAKKSIKGMARKGAKAIVVIGRWHDNHWFDSSNIAPVVKQAKWVRKQQDKFPETKFYFKPWLEYRAASKDVVNSMYRAVRKELGDDIDIIINPESTSYPYIVKDDTILDLHHEHYKAIAGARQMFTSDGKNLSDADISKVISKTNKCEIVMAWDWAFNMKWSEKDSTTRPNRKFLPTEKLMKAYLYMFDNHKDMSNLKNFPGNPSLFKHMSEGHRDTPHRDFKPVALLKDVHGGSLEFKVKGKTIYSIPYVGGFSHDSSLGTYRSFLSQHLFGYEIAELAKAAGSKKGRTDLYVGGITIGKISPAFRMSYSRWRIS